MKTFVLAALILTVPLMSYAETWSGTSTQIGNTVYHNYHSNGITVLPAPQQRYTQDNTAAVAGAMVVGAVAGALIVKGISACINACKPKTKYCYTYWNPDTARYEYCCWNRCTQQYEYFIY